jgi:hypothetical protein
MEDLRSRIREDIVRGRLPNIDCAVAWYSPGRGQQCAACAQRILSTELGIDCDMPGDQVVRFHARCYALWQSVLRP